VTQLQIGREVELQWNTFSTIIYELTGHGDEAWWKQHLAQVLIPVTLVRYFSWFQLPDGEKKFEIVQKRVSVDGFERNHWFWYREA
jgi:hypothetical protein